MVINSRKRYFHIDENASSEQIYALLDIESAHEDDNQSRKKRTKKKNYGCETKELKLPSKKSVNSYQKYNPI